MKRVTGIGGVFFRSKDPLKLLEWYEKHLGLRRDWEKGASFRWLEAESGSEAMTVWSPFPENSQYFGEGEQQYMLNYRVDDLDAVLSLLRSEGVHVYDEREESEYGRFAWIRDPEGRKIELWEPPDQPL